MRESCCQGLESNSLFSCTRFYIGLQLLVSVVLVMMSTQGLEKGKKCCNFLCNTEDRIVSSFLLSTEVLNILLALFLPEQVVSIFFCSHHFRLL